MSRARTSRFCLTLLSVVVGLGLVSVGFSAETAEHCAVHFKLAGACFTIHGRLRLYQGNPLVRIWPIGSHRLLGVTTVSDDPENPNLPSPLNSGLDFETAYVADYTVCPLGPERPGEMRYVCVESIAHLEKRKL
jgi:hypothetical protein